MFVTSHPAVTSSSILESMTSSKPTEDTQELTPSTSLRTEDVPRPSKALKIQASPTLNKQETTSTASSLTKQISFSSAKKETITPPSAKIEVSPIFQKFPSVTLSQSKQTLTSETRVDMTTSKFLKIDASPNTKEERTSSHSIKPVLSTSSPAKQTLSSQIKQEIASSKVLVIEPSPVLKEQEISSQVEEPVASKETESSQTQIEMMSFETVTSSSVVMSSQVEKGEIPLTTMQAASSMKVEPSSLEVNEMSLFQKSTKVFESKSVIASFSSSKEEHSQHIKELATPQPTKTLTLSQLSKTSEAFTSTVVDTSIVHKRSSKFENMTSQPHTKLTTSLQLLTSSEASTGSVYSSKHLEDMTSLQQKKTVFSSPTDSSSQIMVAMSSSQTTKGINLSFSQTSPVENTLMSSLIAHVMTSSKPIKDLSSSQTLKPTHTKEVKIVKSTLILSSSKLADLITSADPMTMKAMTSATAAPTDEKIPSTTPLVEEKVSTRAKTLATTQSPKEKTTTSSEINTSAEKPVAMTTSRPKPTMTKLAKEHPSTKSSKPTHHGKPIHPSESTHHGDKNTTNTTHGGHVVHPGPHSTMGYPHEPPVVNAQTKEKEENGWQISILVVCSMLIGIVAFVVVFVIKSNREMRLVSLEQK